MGGATVEGYVVGCSTAAGITSGYPVVFEGPSAGSMACGVADDDVFNRHLNLSSYIVYNATQSIEFEIVSIRSGIA